MNRLTTRGTEHAKAMRKFGGGNANWSLYKAKEMSRYSFCDPEIAMAKHRVMPKMKSQ
uniref:Uncharacterized protein n=1 Tax=Angiostrongylus cantonensis TaxID=6313 RepID=A0A0K0DRL8_ANGCA